jgi:hypothetical protein
MCQHYEPRLVKRRGFLATGVAIVSGCGESVTGRGTSGDRSTNGRSASTATTTRTEAPASPSSVDVRYTASTADGAAVRVTVDVRREGDGPVRLVRSDPSGYAVRRIASDGLEGGGGVWEMADGAGTASATVTLTRTAEEPEVGQFDTVTEEWALLGRGTVRSVLSVETDAPVTRSVETAGPGYLGEDVLLVGDHERTCAVAPETTVTVVTPPSSGRARRQGAVDEGLKQVLTARRTLGFDAGDVNVFSIPGFSAEIGEGISRGAIALNDTEFLTNPGGTNYQYFGEGLDDWPLFDPGDDFPVNPELFGVYLKLLYQYDVRERYDERGYVDVLSRFDHDGVGLPEIAALDVMLRDVTGGRRWVLDVVWGLNALSDFPNSPRVNARSDLPFVRSISRDDFGRLIAAIAGRERDGWLAERFWSGGVDPTAEPRLADVSFAYPTTGLQEVESTWVHEFVHLNQRFSLGPKMQWFTEASANYLSGLHQLYEGQTRFETFYRRYNQDLGGATVADRGRLEGYGADRVLCGLDAEIRRASGDDTLPSVFRAMNDHGERIDVGTFAAIVADVAGTSLDGWLDGHLSEPPAADIPNEPTLFTDRERFDLPMPRELGPGRAGCDGV